MTTFSDVLALVSRELPATGVDYVLIGGIAVNYYGYSRHTFDIDFMIAADQIDAVRRIMRDAGFTNIAISDTVGFFTKPNDPLRVDFLRIDPETMRKLIDTSDDIDIQGHTVRIPTLRHLIAMKIFALTQNKERRMGKDLPDIAYLTLLNDLNLESDIKPLCNDFGNDSVYELIRDYLKGLLEP